MLDVWHDTPVRLRGPLLHHLRTNNPDGYVTLLRAAHGELGTPYGLWRDDPVGFCRTVLGETLWQRQRDIMVSVRDQERTAVPSCFSSGKTHGGARIVAWWICVHPAGTAVVVTSGSRMQQVRTQAWPHIRRVVAEHRLPGHCDTAQWKIPGTNGGEVLASWAYCPPEHEPEAVQGVHWPHVLVWIDEAGLVNPLTGRAWLSASTGAHTRILATGNPPVDEEDSWLQQISESPHWNTVPIAAAATPNWTGEDVEQCRSCPDWRQREHNVGEHLISPRDVRVFADDWGEESSFYAAKVEARFEKGAPNKTVPAAWIRAARLGTTDGADVDPTILMPPGSRIRLGVDLAQGGGDELAVARKVGRLSRIVRTQAGMANRNTFDVAGYVREEIEAAQKLRGVSPARDQFGKPYKLDVVVDATGDRGPVDTLRAWNTEGLLGPDVAIIGVNFGEGADERDRYANRRAEMWWNLRNAIKPDESGDRDTYLYVDDKTAGQLGDPRYKTNNRGQIVIESKDDMKARGRQSPDRGDAICLAEYDPPSLRPRRRGGIIAGA